VAERTAVLTAANEQLKKELAELKQAAEAAREGQINFDSIVNSIPVPVAVTSPSGEVEALNQTTLEYFGKTFEELKGWKSSDVVHPDDLQRTAAAQLEAHETGSSYNVESRHRSADGSYRWFNVLGLPLRDAQGHIRHWFHLQIDIDDRKRAEAQLAGEKRLLEMVASGSPLKDVLIALCRFVEDTAADCKCGVYLIDWSGPTFHTGAAPNMPATFNDVLEGLTVEATAGPCAVAALTGSQVIAADLESDLHWQQSLIRPLALDHGLRAQWSTPIHSRDGSVLGTFAIFQDHPSRPTQVQRDLIAQVTHIASIAIERAFSEEALKRSERELQLTIDTIPAMAWSAHPDGSGEFFNQHYLDYVGLSAEQVRDWGWTAAIHPDDRENLALEWQRIMASKQSGETEARLRRHDGEYRWFLSRTNPVRDEFGAIVKWYGINTDIDDRKRAEAQRDRTIEELQGQQSMLSDSEQRFRTIFDEAGAGIALVDLQQSEARIRTNRALQTMLNLTQEELGFPKTFDELTASDHREADAATYRELREGKSNSLRLEKHFVLRDGSSVFANVIFTLLRDAAGLPRFIVAIHEDITERRRAVERLQANRDLLALAQKSARAMAFDWYVQQEVNYWSPEQEALHGLPPGSFEGTYKSWKKTIYTPDWPVLLNAIKHAEETGEVTAEWRIVWPDGSLHWLATTGQMYFDDQGKPFRLVGFTADVTRRKTIEEELSRSAAFLAQAQQLSLTGSFSWRVATDKITWSAELYRIYEFEPGTPITFEVIRSRVHPEDLTLYEKMVEQARNGADDFEWQYRLLMPDQSIKYLHAVSQATRDSVGQLEYIAAVRDVTARRLSDEALDRARSELARVARVMSLGALTASIAHEVNQPLSGIITNASTCLRMLAADPPNVDGARETTQRTIRDGHRAADVITRLRALFTRKDTTFEAVDLNEAAQEVIALSLSDLQRNRVILRPQLADDLPLVAGDRVQLQQVILNLVRNASDAMSTVNDRSRHLLIKTEPDEDDQVRLSVRDAGVGFDPQAMKRLFETFYTTKNEGMGIGLSVSRSIIESHHGRLWATPNDGPGSTFSFSLPRGTTNQY
jgi:PAS domain S-box-containing protein